MDRSGSTDSFDSNRMLAEVAVTGQMEGAGFNIFPQAQFAYFAEETDAYTSGTLGAVAASKASIGQARFSALLERPFAMASGRTITPYGELGGLYTHTYEGSLATGSFVEAIEGWSSEACLGMRYTTDSGTYVNASVGVGGLLTDAESYNARLSVTIPLN